MIVGALLELAVPVAMRVVDALLGFRDATTICRVFANRCTTRRFVHHKWSVDLSLLSGLCVRCRGYVIFLQRRQGERLGFVVFVVDVDHVRVCLWYVMSYCVDVDIKNCFLRCLLVRMNEICRLRFLGHYY